MVAGYHLIWTAYGCWLPNDPRGSSSLEIRIPAIAGLAELHQGRRIIQPAGWVICQFYEEADDLLKHPRLVFTDAEIGLIGESLGKTIGKHRYTCYACAVMPDHVHLLIRKHRHEAEQMIAHLQKGSRDQMIAAGYRAFTHPVWGGPGWKVFLQTSQDIEQVIYYIEQNPVKIGRPAQRWSFVKSYDGWIPGRRLR
jgi:REP element-mobilizing transposase RayT